MEPNTADPNVENTPQHVPSPGQTIQPGGQFLTPQPPQPAQPLSPVQPITPPAQAFPTQTTQPAQPPLPPELPTATITSSPITPASVTALEPEVVASNAFNPSAAPGPVVAGIVMGGDNSAAPPPPPTKFKFLNSILSKKPLVIGILASVLILGSASAYYFGYYTNPSVVLSQSLTNTGKGYDKLISYVDQQSKVHYKGSEGKGTYNVKSGKTTTDGSYSFTTNGANSDSNIDIGYGTGRVKAEIRTVKAPTGETPDIYVKATGLTGLGGLSGDPKIDKAISQYEGKWISIDHTLLDNLGSSVLSASSLTASNTTSEDTNIPTEAQIFDELQTFGNVNKNYVFTTNKARSVATVVKTYGMETVDGHKTIHYKMVLNKDHVKQYIIAQQAALKTSKLYDWIKKTGSQKDVDDSFKSMEDSTKDITSKDTFELWADVNTRLVYKIRTNDTGADNPAANYVDIGLDYKGGSDYPFFISGQSKDSSSTDGGKLVVSLNPKTKSVGLNADFKWSGDSPGTFSTVFTFTPTNNVTKIDVPAGAVPLSKVLSDLGLSDDLSSYLNSAGTSTTGAPGDTFTGGTQTTAKDSKRQTDIKSLQTQLEAFFSQNGNYPSFDELNDASWRSVNMKSLDSNALQDPDGSSTKLVTKPAAKVYSYDVTDDNGGSCEDDSTTCAKYTLTTTLSDGTAYSVSELD